jgi:single-strand selective monofunctional uracil DNA glycosylase
MRLEHIIDDLIADLRSLDFGPPVTHVYNPFEYARKAHTLYLRRYGGRPKEIVLVGMNPGPWGMAQTGVPFGEVTAVRDWLGIKTSVGTPDVMHPKRPVDGFACKRSEVSGKRLWGWARETFKTPEQFFSRFFVANYCPLLFIEDSGRNRTPNHIRASERKPLLRACDRAFRRSIEWINPRYIVGIGQFAADRASAVFSGGNAIIGQVTHPSPANPKANRVWHNLITRELSGLGINI